MMYRWDPERALELIERERVTTFVGVPTMSWDLLESPDFAERDTSSLVSVGGGGAPAPPELVRRVDQRLPQGPAPDRLRHDRDQRLRPAEQRAPTTCASRPAPAGRCRSWRSRSRTRTGTRCPPGEVGEIWFRGPNLIRGYWNKPEATAETIADGWLRSGDLGRLDDEGFIYVEDRAKDMVLRAGENIYCAEVEGAIYEFPGVYGGRGLRGEPRTARRRGRPRPRPHVGRDDRPGRARGATWRKHLARVQDPDQSSRSATSASPATPAARC